MRFKCFSAMIALALFALSTAAHAQNPNYTIGAYSVKTTVTNTTTGTGGTGITCGGVSCEVLGEVYGGTASSGNVQVIFKTTLTWTGVGAPTTVNIIAKGVNAGNVSDLSGSASSGAGSSAPGFSISRHTNPGKSYKYNDSSLSDPLSGTQELDITLTAAATNPLNVFGDGDANWHFEIAP